MKIIYRTHDRFNGCSEKYVNNRCLILDYSFKGERAERYFNLDGLRHRIGGPAMIFYHRRFKVIEGSVWYLYGIEHREENYWKMINANDL